MFLVPSALLACSVWSGELGMVGRGNRPADLTGRNQHSLAGIGRNQSLEHNLRIWQSVPCLSVRIFLVPVCLLCFVLVGTEAIAVPLQVPVVFVLRSTGLVVVVVHLGVLHVVEAVHGLALVGVGAASVDCVGPGLLARDDLGAGLGDGLHHKGGVHTLSLPQLVLLFFELVQQLPPWFVKRV